MKRIKIKTIFNNNINTVIVTSLVFIISLLIYKNNPVQIVNLRILDDQFVINFIIIVLGFSVAIITILYSTFDKLREQLVQIFKESISKSELSDIDLKMSDCFRSLKEDTLVIFWYLLWAVFMPIFKVINIHYIKWRFNCISKVDMMVIIKLTIIFLTLAALYDIIGTIFKLIETNLGLSKKNN